MVDDPLPGEIAIEKIKGLVPNFITARATIARLQALEDRRAEESGDSPRKIIYCQFCGRSQRSMQGLRAHLRHCKEKHAYQQAASEGITFRIGDRLFTVAARSIKLFAGLERYEEGFNERIDNGEWDPQTGKFAFLSLVIGARLAQPEGWVSLESREVITHD